MNCHLVEFETGTDRGSPAPEEEAKPLWFHYIFDTPCESGPADYIEGGRIWDALCKDHRLAVVRGGENGWPLAIIHRNIIWKWWPGDPMAVGYDKGTGAQAVDAALDMQGQPFTIQALSRAATEWEWY